MGGKEEDENNIFVLNKIIFLGIGEGDMFFEMEPRCLSPIGTQTYLTRGVQKERQGVHDFDNLLLFLVLLWEGGRFITPKVPLSYVFFGKVK